MEHTKFTLAEKIIRERAKRGWSQTRLAQESKVGRATIARIENGRITNPNAISMSKITKALEIDSGLWEKE